MLSSRTFRTRFHENLRRRRLIGEKGKVITAVSGGVDSIVLLDLLAHERGSLGIDLIVAHFNHQLRGDESEGDEHFVAARAAQYGLELYVDRANTADYARHTRLGTQEAARNLRYDFFAKLLESSGYDVIATAHNADDNAETVLFNLFRGAGVQGLGGIPVVRLDRRIVRPLLFAGREEIARYAELEGLAFREDSSNTSDVYTRNFIRHQILPLVRDQINPNVVDTLQRSSELFRELEVYLTYSARTALDIVTTGNREGELSLSVPRLRSYPQLLQQYVILLAAQTLTGRRPEYDQVGRILDLTEGLTGSWVMLDERTGVYRDRDMLVIRPMESPADFRIVVLQNRSYEFNGFHFSSELLDVSNRGQGNGGSTEYIDADSLPPGDLILRSWAEGDWFVPLGMKARKKISDYFVDTKIPLYEKRNYPVLETKDGNIVWLCGQRLDDRYKITERTRTILKLHFLPPSGKAESNPGKR